MLRGNSGIGSAAWRRTVVGVVGAVCAVLAVSAPAALASPDYNWGQAVEGVLPDNATASPFVLMGSVSCATAGNCAAAGSYLDNSLPNSQRVGLLFSQVTGVWQTGVEAQLPAGASTTGTGAQLQNVSCPSAGSCTVVGQYHDATTAMQGVMISESAGTWQTGVEAPLPGDAASDPNVSFDGVWCSSASDCTAIGTYTSTSGRRALLLSEVAGTWSAQTAPVPGDANADPGVNLSSLSCASAGNCASIGGYTDSADNHQGLILTESAGVWSAQTAPLPGNAASDPSIGLFDVSCPSAGNCAGDGDYADSSGHTQVVLLDESAGTWTAVEGTAPPAAATDPGADMDGLSCVSPGNCTGTGEFDDSSGHSLPSMFTETAGTWSSGVEPSLQNADTDPSATFDNVACTSPGNCAGVGEYTDSSGNQQGSLVTEVSATARPGAEAVPPANAGTNPGVEFAYRGLSCPSAGNCTAVGTYTDSSGQGQALLLDAAPADPTLSATAPGTGSTGTAIQPGSVSAALSNGATPSGTITLKVFGPQPSPPSSCSSGGTTVGTAGVSGNGAYHPSSGFTPSTPGTYWWSAAYGGDTGDSAAASTCGAGMTQTVVRDTSAPSISITTPADGASYRQGQKVTARYSCADPDGTADVASCSGPVASGHNIDTSTPGSHSFNVSATDRAGNSGSKTVTYTVKAAKPTITTSGRSSAKSAGATEVVDPGIKVACPRGGRPCTATETATVTLSTPAAGIKAKKVVIGRAHFTVPAGKSGELTFKLNSRGARLLRGLHHLRISIVVTARADHGTAAKATKTLRIAAPKHHRRH
jgi:hypothetical protein